MSGPTSPARASATPAQKLADTVPLLMRRLLAEARKRSAWQVVTFQQFGIMRVINSDRLTSQAEIARRLAVSAPVVTRMAQALVESGLAERHDDPSDRRAVLLSLTPRGNRLVRRMERDLVGAADELLQPLTVVERESVDSAMDHLQPLCRATATERPLEGRQWVE